MGQPSYCSHCGANLSAGGNFCSGCGRPIAPVAGPPVAPEPERGPPPLPLEAAKPGPPRDVRRAVTLLYVTSGFEIIRSLLVPGQNGWHGIPDEDSRWFALVIVLGLTVFVNQMVLAGQNWARWLWLLLSIATIPIWVHELRATFHYDSLIGLLSSTSTALSFFALYLTFKNTSGWFQVPQR